MARRRAGESRERVFRYVAQRLLEGRPPSLREVQRALGFRAVESARKHLEALVAEGRLVKRAGRARGYELPADPGAGIAAETLAYVPHVGLVQAGELTTALQSPEGYVPLQTRYPAAECFALTVRGESMTGAGILPGDTVIVHRQATAVSGDIVVARVEDEATVKRLRLTGDGVELHAANPAFRPIVPDPESVEILGKVIEVRRRLD